MPENEVRMKIEEDGGITVNTESFEAGEVHMQAEQLIKETFDAAGGDSKVIKRKPGHAAVHGHHHHHQKVGG